MHDLRHYGLVYHALKRGGSIHPITLPVELTNETGIMNPSIFIHNGKILLNVRHVNYTLYYSEGKKFPHTWGPLQYIHPENDITLRTHNIMCELDCDMNILNSGRIKMNLDTKPTWNFIGLEDGRLFSWENRLFLCGVRRDCYDSNGTGRMEMCEIEHIDGEWQEVSRNPIPGPGDNATYCEKNWMPITDQPWHFVKWCNPTEIVKYDIKERTTITTQIDESKFINTFGRDLRGGTQVVPIGDGRHLALTHEVDLTNDAFNRKDGHYNHRVIVWDAEWNIIHYTKDFHFLGTQIDHSGGKEYNIEFATGIAFLDGNVLISFGYQDNGTFILKMPENVFFEFLARG
jgi:predicted GH43/DUF377 family glycosyl hydrolase